jgi:hypothetical protein
VLERHRYRRAPFELALIELPVTQSAVDPAAASIEFEYIQPYTLAPQPLAAIVFQRRQRARSRAATFIGDHDTAQLHAARVGVQRQDDKSAGLVMLVNRQVNNVIAFKCASMLVERGRQDIGRGIGVLFHIGKQD